MQGVAAGAWPQQYEVAEFETAANCTLAFTGRTEYDSRTGGIWFLPEGDLPPLEERLPEEPLVVVPYNEIGHYGGRFTGASIAPKAATPKCSVCAM
jgi:peptide/nickel transport system substrate-binding protein